MVWRGGGFRIAAALALAAVLVTAAPLHAAGPVDPNAANRPVLEALWIWARAWLGLPTGEIAPASTHAPRKVDCDGGSHIDPNGCPAQSSPAGPTSDGGSQIDPDG